MCTVTYIPCSNGFFLTSNRDEKYTRSLAESPCIHEHDGTPVMYPKDQDAKGTWIALKNTGDAICLLNGAFEAHTPRPPYRRSRGLVALDIITQADMANCFNELDLHRVEPFTMIMVQEKKLFECRWDGAQKFILQLDNQQRFIWSSSTLYPFATRLHRKQWFDMWQSKLHQPHPPDIFKFHMLSGDGDAHNALVMNRNNEVFTVSITGISVQGNSIKMQYFDLVKNEITNMDFEQNLQFC